MGIRAKLFNSPNLVVNIRLGDCTEKSNDLPREALSCDQNLFLALGTSPVMVCSIYCISKTVRYDHASPCGPRRIHLARAVLDGQHSVHVDGASILDP